MKRDKRTDEQIAHEIVETLFDARALHPKAGVLTQWQMAKRVRTNPHRLERIMTRSVQGVAESLSTGFRVLIGRTPQGHLYRIANEIRDPGEAEVIIERACKVIAAADRVVAELRVAKASPTQRIMANEWAEQIERMRSHIGKLQMDMEFMSVETGKVALVDVVA